jgi:hypothetical protein
MKSFFEFYQQVVNELAPLTGDTFGIKDPVKLSTVAANADLAQAAAKGGQKDNNPKDDVVQAVENSGGPVGGLKPSQKTLVSDKILNFALASLLKESWMDLTNMQAIVSADDAIMDGHHRWAAALLVDPNMQVKYAKIMLPLKKLITILNIYTVGALNRTKGNPDEGETIQAAFSNLLKKIPAALQNGFQFGKSNYAKDQVEKAFASISGADGNPQEGLKIMIANVNAALSDKEKMKSATDIARDDMPVINKEEVSKLCDELLAGNLDHISPLSQAVIDAVRARKPAGAPAPAVPGAPAAPGAPAVPKPVGAAPAAPGAPVIQNASTEYYGYSVMEQMMILSGIATSEQLDHKKGR